MYRSFSVNASSMAVCEPMGTIAHACPVQNIGGKATQKVGTSSYSNIDRRIQSFERTGGELAEIRRRRRMSLTNLTRLLVCSGTVISCGHVAAGVLAVAVCFGQGRCGQPIFCHDE